jgi:hypothetical protein
VPNFPAPPITPAVLNGIFTALTAAMSTPGALDPDKDWTEVQLAKHWAEATRQHLLERTQALGETPPRAFHA